MAYTPSTLTSWSSPISILAADKITDLDNDVNAIITSDAGSLVNFVNDDIGDYLADELTAIYDEINGSILTNTDWATDTVGGVLKMDYDSGTSTLYITNDGTDATA